jgi:FkbM family methyltransferase
MFDQVLNTIKFIKKHPVGNKAFIKCLKAYLRWQLGTRILRKDIIHEFVGGTKLIIRRGMVGATGNVYVGIHEFEHMAFLLHVCGRHDIFFDIGSNVGSYSILATGVCKSKSICFEPIKTTYKLLQDNIRLNDLQDLCVSYNVGVGSEVGSLFFTKGLDTMNRVALVQELSDEKEKVDVITLDSLSEKFSATILKIDVEGYELNVLYGAKDLLDSNLLHSIIIELNEYNAQDNSTKLIHELLLSKSFKRYRYLPFKRSLVKLEGIPSESGNAIYIKDLHFERILKVLKSSTSFSLFGIKI